MASLAVEGFFICRESQRVVGVLENFSVWTTVIGHIINLQ